MGAESREYYRQIQDLIENSIPFFQVIVVATRSSAPQSSGARILVTQTGLAGGTVGGGRLEAKVIKICQEQLESSSPAISQLVNWNLTADVGMTCGGEVMLFFDGKHAQIWKVAVFGAGHVAQALIPLLLPLNCHVSCFDERDEWLAQLPKASNLLAQKVQPLAEAVDDLSSDCFILSMTQGHAFDLPVLERVLKKHEPPYVGVIGSATKGLILKKHLRAAGVSKDRAAAVICPIGFSIGSRNPAEIAISIAAQLLQYREKVLSARVKLSQNELPVSQNLCRSQTAGTSFQS